MTLSSSQQAALRAKKAIANGNTSFKPRGEKNKAAFEVLKEQEAQSMVQNISASNSVFAGSPPHKKTKITAASSSHTSVLANALDFNPENICEEEEEQEDDAVLAKIKTHKEKSRKWRNV